ncbi:hypothetical protein GW17_00044139 [Ensete ventricosum]|nr:hypothetical protein GW17_00044139 [Ensete ventricosum]
MRLLACGGCRYWRARPPLVRPLLHAVVACPCRCCHSGCGQPLMANPRAAAAYARPTQRPAWVVSSVTAAVSTMSQDDPRIQEAPFYSLASFDSIRFGGVVGEKEWIRSKSSRYCENTSLVQIEGVDARRRSLATAAREGRSSWGSNVK